MESALVSWLASLLSGAVGRNIAGGMLGADASASSAARLSAARFCCG